MSRISSSGFSPPAARLLWPTALVLTFAVSAACLLFSVAGPGGGMATAALVGTVVTAAVGIVLVSLFRKHLAASAALAQLKEAIEQARREHERLVEQHELAIKRQSEVSARQFEQLETRWRQHMAARSAAVEEALQHLVRVRLPAALGASPVPPALADGRVDGPLARLLDAVLTELAAAAKDSREREESLRLAVVSLSRRVQTGAHSIQAEASLLARKYEHDYAVVESSMRVDHAAAQQARHAQSLAVLCGEWPGQQWQEPLALVDVVRAAAARILPYERIEVSGDQDVAAAAEVVEPVIHLVAELLANATQSSPPAIRVPVNVRRVQQGAVIEIDDGGICMDEHRMEQAREVVSGRRPVALGEIPQTGLAVDTLWLMVTAGHETTLNLITNTVRALLTHPDQRALALAGEVTWAAVIEEVLGWDAPIGNFLARYPRQDITIAGITIPAGDAVLAPYTAVGRDPAQHDTHADRFDITREPTKHLAFGGGPHICLGAPLARLEATIAVRELFVRYPDLELATAPEDLTPIASLFSNSIQTLPVHLAPPRGHNRQAAGADR